MVFEKIKTINYPKKIIAKISKDFVGKKTDIWKELYLHVPNEFDKLSNHYHYYYDIHGEEIPFSAILEYKELN